jgi:hypothetical protein
MNDDEPYTLLLLLFNPNDGGEQHLTSYRVVVAVGTSERVGGQLLQPWHLLFKKLYTRGLKNLLFPSFFLYVSMMMMVMMMMVVWQ